MAQARCCSWCRRSGWTRRFAQILQRAGGFSRAGVPGREPAASRRRCAAAAAAGRVCGACADGGDQRRALSRAGAASAAGRADLHPRALPHRPGRVPPRAQCRAASEVAGRDGAAVPRASGRRRAHGGDRASAAGFSLDDLAYEYPDEPVPPGRRRTSISPSWPGRVPRSGFRRACRHRCATPWRRSCGSSRSWAMRGIS